jgi:hypothetical protein
VDADADSVGFHVAFSDHKHGVNFICSARWILPLIFSVLSSISAGT